MSGGRASEPEPVCRFDGLSTGARPYTVELGGRVFLPGVDAGVDADGTQVLLEGLAGDLQ